MNVTLTFNVFFGPLAIGLLVGCGSVKNYEFSQIDEKIQLEQSKLRGLRITLAEIDTQQERLGEFLNYANSPTGKRFYLNAQCITPPSRVRPQTHKHTCKTPVHSEQLTGKCVIKYNNTALQSKSGAVVKTITGLLCIAGPGKAPKWIRIPGPGKFAFNGAIRLIRSMACASTVSTVRPLIQDQYSCKGQASDNCIETLAHSKKSDTARLQQIELEARDTRAALDRCESLVRQFPGMNRHSAQDRLAALEKRAVELVSVIGKTQKTILDAQALKITVNAQYQDDQEYTPTDPG